MINNLARKVFGSRNDRLLKQYGKIVKKINELEPEIKALSDDDLKGKAQSLKNRVQEQGESLDSVLVEAFAVCREASFRILSMRHFDVQLIGGIALHQGKISEMKTGEGKTLVATLAVFLNALSGEGVHVVTVNDYLASRDATTLEPLYQFLGLTVGVNLSQMDHEQKQKAYACDITYGTNNEFGFDYLRDNMVQSADSRVQRKLFFAVVDEVDSILIDEARTPLIISGQAEDNLELYNIMNKVPSMLVPQETEEGSGDYWVDGKTHQVAFSEEGLIHAEQILSEFNLLPEGESLYSTSNIILMHHLLAALRAHTLFHKDQHYVVHDNEVIIVDEFTGRLMPGRRWSDGLHQAVEAKEGVNINRENQTLASITFQNYFRLYEKLSGMTGTADTEAFEFQNIYGLETVIIPTNRNMVRKDYNDQIFKTAEEKYEAIINEIKEKNELGQPILVGTTSIENSELISELLKKEKLAHHVLNAKEHDKEAYIITQAGKPGMITVATNMAGRGTDIVLGGNIAQEIKDILNNEKFTEEENNQKISSLQNTWNDLHQQVISSGGLHIIGTERHESRRIDNQLRGRAGRQGDPGSSRFFLSFEDNLLKYFALDRAGGLLNRLAPERGVPIEHKILNRQIEGAQRKVEGRNFDARKQLLEYDDVTNDQRKVIYHLRNDILDHNDISEFTTEIREEVITNMVEQFIPAESMEEEWDLEGLQSVLHGEFGLAHVDMDVWKKENPYISGEQIKDNILKLVEEEYERKEQIIGSSNMRDFEQRVLLNVLDQNWKDHLAMMDHLRQGIHLRGYGQKNPKQEYKKESFHLFQNLLEQIKKTVVQYLVSIRIEQGNQENEVVDHQTDDQSNDQNSLIDQASERVFSEDVFSDVGRNDPCPCESGLKFKACHGKVN